MWMCYINGTLHMWNWKFTVFSCSQQTHFDYTYYISLCSTLLTKCLSIWKHSNILFKDKVSCYFTALTGNYFSFSKCFSSNQDGKAKYFERYEPASATSSATYRIPTRQFSSLSSCAPIIRRSVIGYFQSAEGIPTPTAANFVSWAVQPSPSASNYTSYKWAYIAWKYYETKLTFDIF